MRPCRRIIFHETHGAFSRFFAQHPRHRKLLSINKIYNGHPEAELNLRHDWSSLLSDDETLLFKHYSTDLFPSAEHGLDLDRYRDKKVAILGGGNSAFEVADHLAGAAAIIHVLTRRPIRHAWQTHFPGDLRAINNNLLDMYQLESLHATLGYQPTKIVRRPDGSLRVHLEEPCPHWSIPSTINVTFDYDELICCTGWRYIEPGLFADSVRPESDADGRYPQLSPMWESTVPGIYFIGTAMAARDKRAASSFIHGFRYNVRTLFHLLEERHQGVSLPAQPFELKAKPDLMALAAQVIDRVSVSSGLYQMNAFLADVVLVSSGQVRYIRELPVDLIEERQDFHEAEHVFTVTLEYGFHNYPSWLQSTDFIRPSDALRNECSAFLHPVLRRWEGGQIADEQHLGESLTIRYDRFFSPDAFMDGFDDAFRRMNEHIVANFLNKHVNIVDEVFSEQSLSEEHFGKFLRPWKREEVDAYRKAQDQREKRDGMKPCRFSP